MLIEDGPDHEDLPFQNSSPLDIGCSGSNNGDRSMSDSAILTENDEAAKGDLHIGETSAHWSCVRHHTTSKASPETKIQL